MMSPEKIGFAVRSPSGDSKNITIDSYPDECPVCHSVGEIKRDLAQGYLFPTSGPQRECGVQVIFRCPRLQCGSHFIVEYWGNPHSRHESAPYHYRRKKTFPRIPKNLPVPERVSKISERFVLIRNQANEAEQNDLNEIAGIGYRKSLEFLIKDYCIHKNEDKIEDIKSATLAQCINKYVSDQNIKGCAQRATWLGNDETHYQRIWSEYDNEDLKALISLTLNWIDNELLTDHYLKKMESRKQKKG